MTLAGQREPSEGASGRRRLQRLVDLVVIIAGLTPVAVLAGLTILMLLVPLLPDSWTDSWFGIHP